ncbi:MAG: zinc ribbon domain-containing protein [Novosphingobium sp.]|jgi:uncharacterized OB-fold protein|nr:zinc ribbon domain-containing protein [Novosphingobium sp.]
MPSRSTTHDLSRIAIAMDTWTRPFWEAADRERLVVPRCGRCGHYRWPPGPFCPQCHSQETEWVDPGRGRIYSFTVLSRPPATEGGEPELSVPTLVRFADAGGTLLLGSLADAPIAAIAIDAPVTIGWAQAANTRVPIFHLA